MKIPLAKNKACMPLTLSAPSHKLQDPSACQKNFRYAKDSTMLPITQPIISTFYTFVEYVSLYEDFISHTLVCVLTRKDICREAHANNANTTQAFRDYWTLWYDICTSFEHGVFLTKEPHNLWHFVNASWMQLLKREVPYNHGPVGGRTVDQFSCILLLSRKLRGVHSDNSWGRQSMTIISYSTTVVWDKEHDLKETLTRNMKCKHTSKISLSRPAFQILQRHGCTPGVKVYQHVCRSTPTTTGSTKLIYYWSTRRTRPWFFHELWCDVKSALPIQAHLHYISASPFQELMTH